MTYRVQTLFPAIALMAAAGCVAPAPGEPTPSEPTGRTDAASEQTSLPVPDRAAAAAMPHSCIAGFRGDLGVFEVPQAERDFRVSLEEHVGALNIALMESPFADRAGSAWIEHTPCYRVVASVTDMALAGRVRALADPAIGPYLEVRQTAMNAARWQALQVAVGDRLVAARLAFTAGFDPVTDSIVLTLPTDRAIDRARALIEPGELPHFTIRRGSMPVPL